jgi:hypothetical protein
MKYEQWDAFKEWISACAYLVLSQAVYHGTRMAMGDSSSSSSNPNRGPVAPSPKRKLGGSPIGNNTVPKNRTGDNPGTFFDDSVGEEEDVDDV